MKITEKEYCQAIRHWEEIYYHFRINKFIQRETGNWLIFGIATGKDHSIHYGARNCSYCQALSPAGLETDCDPCPLSDIRCEAKSSPWYKFRIKPCAETALDMLLAIIEHKPGELNE